jgi:hypothetical protein
VKKNLTFKDLKKRVTLETTTTTTIDYLKDQQINHFGSEIPKSIKQRPLGP